MASRRGNGGKHHPRKHPSNDQNNRRRLSKQEEIDLTVDGIDLKEDTMNGDDKCNNWNISETTAAPTIQVNAVEDKCDHKLTTEKDNDLDEEVDNNCTQTMHKLDSNSGQSLNGKEKDTLLTEDNKEKKRGKHLARAEAVRDTSASPPPTQGSDSEDKSCHMLTVGSSNTQSQLGSSMSPQNNRNKLKAQGSSSGSADMSSPCLSRDSSTENSSDLTGTDVQQFIIDTLLNNTKDRGFLLKIEQELNVLVKDCKLNGYKFPPMTSYNRMLVHRVAALFGFEHNVDILGKAVVVTKCKNTRIPDLKFKDYIKEDSLTEPKKSILKRDSASLEDGSNGSNVSFDGKEKSPDRQNASLCDGTRNKSFEEREERYEKARARIFNQESSSSNEGLDANNHVMTDNVDANHLREKTSSPPNSQSAEDLSIKPNNNNISKEVKAWSSTDSDSSGRQTKNDAKPLIQPNTKSCDLDLNSKPNPTTTSAKINLLAPDGHTSDRNKSTVNHFKNRPAVAKASSFGGISHNIDSSHNNTVHNISKSGSFNNTSNTNQLNNVSNNVNTNRMYTPKNRTENVHKPHMNSNSLGGVTHHSEHRYVSSQHPSHHSSNTSQHNRHSNWHQNSHSRSNRVTNTGNNGIQWPQMVNQSYPHFLLHQQNDPNTNQMKENQYLQSGQQVFLQSLANYGQQTINNEHQQHMTQQPIRLIYPNPNAPQMQSNLSSFGGLLNSSLAHQSVATQMNSMPFPLQSTSNGINYSGNQSNIQNNTMISPPINGPFGTQLQVPSNMGNVWLIGNNLYPQSTSPMIACPPPANTPPSAPIGSNIAPFVGMSYQQYRPTINSNVQMNQNMGLNAAQTRAPPPLLKNHPMMTTQANQHRIVTSNANQFVQQSVPDMLDLNGLMGTNNYVNRGPVVPQANHQMRRLPMNANQGLDVRLVGQQSSPPFLLPTPQRQYFPVPNAMPVNQRHSYENNSNANQQHQQRLKSSFNKNKSNRYTNNRNILMGNNTNAHHYSNT